MLIAIDGPGGSGKSTVARSVAARLGLAHLDTGAMYRAVAYAALRDGVDPGDGPALGRLARQMKLDAGERVIVDGEDATAAIRRHDVTAVVSQVSAHRAVRQEMVRRQRSWADAHGGGVVEGRDIGSVVFPRADLKVYLTASDAERARRRASDLGSTDPRQVASDLAARDRLDSTRAVSPLTVADGALVIDTTGQGVEDVVEEVLAQL